MSYETNHPPTYNLGPTGTLLRRALPAVSAPERFRTELLRRLVEDQARAALARGPQDRRPSSPR